MVDVTRDAVSHAQLQHVDPFVSLHERFVADIPAESDGPERAVAVFRVCAEEVGLLHADAGIDGIKIVIRVAGIEIGRDVTVQDVRHGEQFRFAPHAGVELADDAVLRERRPVDLCRRELAVVEAVAFACGA